MGCGSSILCCWEAEEEPHFHLMKLPNELILMILHRMTTVDRLRARVNRKLYLLESVGKFHSTGLIMGRNWQESNTFKADCCFKDQEIHMKVDWGSSRDKCFDGLTKLASNVCMHKLEVAIVDSTDIQFFPYINRISAGGLCVAMGNGFHDLVKIGEDLLDKYLEEWMCNREIVKLSNFDALRADHLFRVFNMMERGECSMRSLIVKYASCEEYRVFLGLLGILYAEGQFSSERRDVEVYRISKEEKTVEFNFVIGSNMVISSQPFDIYDQGHIRITRLNNDGSVRNNRYYHGISIGDLRMCKSKNIEEALVKLPVTYR